MVTFPVLRLTIALQANFAGSAGLRNWKPLDSEPLRADVTVRNAGVEDRKSVV